jgi:hypothetical protein
MVLQNIDGDSLDISFTTTCVAVYMEKSAI